MGPSFEGGGAERRFTNISLHLFRGAHDVAVLARDKNSEHRISGKVFHLDWSGRLSYFKAIWILRQRIKHERYDVLMAFGFFPSVVSIIATLFAKGDTRLVINEITRPKMEAMNNIWWRTITYNKLRQLLYRRSDLITANSIDGLKETCELAGIAIEHGVRVVNVVDSVGLSLMALKKAYIPLSKGKYVACVGRLDFMKRIDTVVDAFGLLRNRIDCSLVIVGDGMARQALEAQVKALGLQGSVTFTGRVENPLPLLKGAAAFVLASEYEGFSNSVLEAMFCDVPVITSFCSSDAREMCAQGATLGFNVGDANQLAEHIATVVTDEALAQNLVARTREYRAPHAIELAIPVYENLIRRVAGHAAQGHEDSNR